MEPPGATPIFERRDGVGTLALLVVTADPDRWRAALATAQAHAALGGASWLYLHEAAVALLATHAEPVAEAIAIDVRIIACQTGLAACGLHFDALPAGVEAGGLISFLAETARYRLVVF